MSAKFQAFRLSTNINYEIAAIVDVDEYLLPGKANNLTQLLEDRLKTAVKPGYFLFQNVFHYLYWENSTQLVQDIWPALSQKSRNSHQNSQNVPYLLTQTKLRRTKKPHRHGTRSKYITLPDKVTTVGNHVVWKMINGKFLEKQKKNSSKIQKIVQKQEPIIGRKYL